MGLTENRMDDFRKIEEYTDSLKGWKRLAAKLSLKMDRYLLRFMNERLEQVREECANTNIRHQAQCGQLEEHMEVLDKKLEELADLEENIRSINMQLGNAQSAFINLNNNNILLEKIESMQDMHGVKIARLEKSLSIKEAQQVPEFADVQSPKSSCSATESYVQRSREEAHKDVYGGLDYFEFENHFRGSRAQIKENQRIYLDYFKGKEKVLDLGCGRGEFLELLQENGIGGYGVDLYPEFVELCAAKGLPAVCADAVAVIEKEKDVDGIFAGQLIEHLRFDDLIRLTQLAYDRLKPGCHLIYETPNPMSLAIYTHSFYLDPSHQRPVHPLTLKYVLEKAGFREIQVLFTENSRLAVTIPELGLQGVENLKEFNIAMKNVEQTLFGSQDYAVVAVK